MRGPLFRRRVEKPKCVQGYRQRRRGGRAGAQESDFRAFYGDSRHFPRRFGAGERSSVKGIQTEQIHCKRSH